MSEPAWEPGLDQVALWVDEVVVPEGPPVPEHRFHQALDAEVAFWAPLLQVVADAP